MSVENSDSEALKLWRERLDYFQKQEAIAADPAQKFNLAKQIQEASAKIEELEKRRIKPEQVAGKSGQTDGSVGEKSIPSAEPPRDGTSLVSDRSASGAVTGTSGESGIIQERFQQWARKAEPPQPKSIGGIPGSGVAWIVSGFMVAIVGTIVGICAVSPLSSAIWKGAIGSLPGLLAIIYGVSRIARARGLFIEPVPVLVLSGVDRYRGRYDDMIHIEGLSGERRQIEGVGKTSRSVYSGDLGWAYISENFLLEFIPARPNLAYKTQKPPTSLNTDSQ